MDENLMKEIQLRLKETLFKNLTYIEVLDQLLDKVEESERTLGIDVLVNFLQSHPCLGEAYIKPTTLKLNQDIIREKPEYQVIVDTVFQLVKPKAPLEISAILDSEECFLTLKTETITKSSYKNEI
jgi:hypothetical protein